ncbi:uncharacterized protein METZ01_LOCUS285155, partial [marine metagenome]
KVIIQLWAVKLTIESILQKIMN